MQGISNEKGKLEPQNIEYRTPNVEVKKTEAKETSIFGFRYSLLIGGEIEGRISF